LSIQHLSEELVLLQQYKIIEIGIEGRFRRARLTPLCHMSENGDNVG